MKSSIATEANYKYLSMINESPCSQILFTATWFKQLLFWTNLVKYLVN